MVSPGFENPRYAIILRFTTSFINFIAMLQFYIRFAEKSNKRWSVKCVCLISWRNCCPETQIQVRIRPVGMRVMSAHVCPRVVPVQVVLTQTKWEVGVITSQQHGIRDLSRSRTHRRCVLRSIIFQTILSSHNIQQRAPLFTCIHNPIAFLFIHIKG